MKLGMQIDYAGGFKESAQKVAAYEKAGLDIAWVAEAYGFDGPSFMGYLAATTETITIASGILPIYTRTPTLLAMTAAGMDALTDGRFILGLGASGPQVIEGFHGVKYDAPLGRTREIVEICRQVWTRERVVHDGRYYHLPLPAGEGTGLGKPLKIIAKPVRERIPIWIASLGPKNVELTAEIAEGWLPIFYLPERARDVWGADLDAGAAKRDDSLGTLEIAAGGLVAIGDDAAGVAELMRPMAALYIGGMGAKGKNFYNDLMCRYGYEEEAEKIQDLYLDGKKDEAAALVPAEFLRMINLCGPEGFVKERIAAFEEAGVTVLNITPVGGDPLATIETLRSWTS
jgi:F420-dependent oxidoreductase-like protein